jgi:large subunit ribosomal protein L28
MSKVCEVTGKRAMRGFKVSHSNHKTIKFTQPNLQDKRFWLGSEARWVKLRISVAAMREIDKRGIEAVVRDLRAAGKSV